MQWWARFLLELLKKIRPLKGFLLLCSSDWLWQPQKGGICSGQNLTTLQDRDTCPATPGVSQVDDELEIPVGSYSTLRGERQALPWHHTQPWGDSLGPCPSPHSTPRRGPRAFSFPDTRNFQISSWPPRHRLSAETPAFTGHNSAVRFPKSWR